MLSRLGVTTAASTRHLTTLVRVKVELGIVGTASDGLLTSKIGEASSDIEGHVGRVLRLESVEETFWGLGAAVQALVLRRVPVVEIASVIVDGDVLDAALYRVDSEAGLLYRLAADGSVSCWSACRDIVVAYDGGYVPPGETGANMPAAIEAAAVELVSGYWAARGRDPSVREVDVPGVLRTVYWVGAVGSAGELPPGVSAKLAPYWRLAV